MLSMQEKCETNSVELPARQIESAPHSSDCTAEDERMNKNAGATKKNKRKKSTSIERISVENESTDTIHVDYKVVEHENKRQKIEIPSNRKSADESGKSTLDKSSPVIAKPKDVKNPTETNKLRLKYENIHTNTVQKLNAQADQLRMEISTLRTALANEQNAVRVLR